MVKPISFLLFLSILFCFASCKNNPGKINITSDSLQYWYTQLEKVKDINTDTTLYYTKKLEENSKNAAPEYQAMAALASANYHSKKSSGELSVREFNRALDLLKASAADTLVAKAYNGLGVSYLKMSDNALALDYFFKSLRIYEKENNSKGIAGVNSNIGEVYQLKGELNLAKQYLQRAMKAQEHKKSERAYLSAAQTLANIYGINNQFDSALAIDNMGIAISDSIQSSSAKSMFYNNKGNCYLVMGKYDSAAYYYNQCVLIDSANGTVSYMADNYLSLGSLAAMQKKYAEAEKNFRYSIRLGDSIKSNRFKYLSWSELASIYTAQNNYVKALEAKDSVAAIKDRVINEKSESKIAELKELYETEKKEQTISLQETKLSRQRLVIVGGSFVIALLLLSGYLFYRRYKLKREKELQQTLIQQREEATINILTAEEKERKRIAADLHDGVGQLMTAAWLNLQVLEKQTPYTNDERQQLLSKTTLLVSESCKEVRQVSHNMMPNALLKKGLVNAVREFTQQIDSSVLSINLQSEGLNMELDSITETILYRVIQESVNNAIKHAAATELDISIHNSAEGIDMLIEDNGKGFDITTVDNNENGLGLQNIRSRILFLKGSVDWDTSPGNGTVVAIHIPPKS